MRYVVRDASGFPKSYGEIAEAMEDAASRVFVAGAADVTIFDTNLGIEWRGLRKVDRS